MTKYERGGQKPPDETCETFNPSEILKKNPGQKLGSKVSGLKLKIKPWRNQ